MGNQIQKARKFTSGKSAKNPVTNTFRGHSLHEASNDPYFEAAVNATKTRSYRLATRHGLSLAEREDIQQELMIDLLAHRDSFDPAKGSLGTFTGMVSKHRSLELLDKLKKHRKRFFDFSVASKMIGASNDSEMGSFETESSDNLIDKVKFNNDTDHDLFNDGMVMHDIKAAIAFMNGEQSALLDLLIKYSDIANACAASGLSSATFYRRVNDLRMHLRMFGIRPAA
jgi:RNA polymerase sigma-70 factor (ECF subfamily)